MSLSFYIKKAMVKAIFICTALYVVVVMGMDNSVPNVIRPHATGSPVELMERHNCWNGNAPADMVNKIPGHVVIRIENTGTAVYGGPKMVSIAFAQVFDNATTDHEIYGFCR